MSEEGKKALASLFKNAEEGLNKVAKTQGFSLRLIEIKGSYYYYPEVETDWKPDEN